MERLQVWGWFSLAVLTAAQSPTLSPGPSPPSYLLLAPRVVRPGVAPSLSVTILTNSSVTVIANITYLKQLVASTTATVKGGSTKLVTFPPIHVNESDQPFILTVSGRVGKVQVFSNLTELQFDPRGHSTFIQTDKRNYLPGQVVKIRAVSVRPDGKPFASPVDIIIKDPRGNLLRQWLGANSELGIVSKEYQLTENPPLGEWTIVATDNGLSSKAYFIVDHYVLPKFEVVISAPDLIFHEDNLSGSVTAKYSYGKPVQGHMNITLSVHSYGVTEVFRSSSEIDGTEAFSLQDSDDSFLERSLETFVYSGDENKEFVSIEVNVTEGITGVTYGSKAKVSLAKHRYKLSFYDHPKTLRPSVTFTARLELSTYNNQPLSLEDQQKVVLVSVIQQRPSLWNWAMGKGVTPSLSPLNVSDLGDETPMELSFPVPADGVIPLSIVIPEDLELLTIDASFEDAQNTLQVQRSYSSPGNFYLQIQRPSTPAQIGSPLLLHIERNFQKTELHYIVKSRGQMVSAGKGSPDVTLVPDVLWSPLASVVVYTVTPSGEVVNDMMELPVAQTLQNQVSLSWGSALKRPGDNVTLSVTVADPDCLVGILVVDKTTQWMGSNNDITKEKVLEDMKGYNVDTIGDPQDMEDPYSVFESCGLVALTDASLHKILTYELWPFIEVMFDKQTMVDSPPMEPRERWNFPETWLWMDTKTGSSKRAEIIVTVPDSITSWTATAFVMSEKLGLGITEQPAELTVFQDFFLFLNLPAYVIRGEVVLLEVVLFNYLPLNLEVIVTVENSNAFEFDFSDVGQPAVPSTRQVSVGSEKQKSVLFPIRPLVLGEIVLSVKATSSTASDFVHKVLLVKAEGLEQTFSTSLLLEVSPSQPSQARNISFTFPADVVNGSSRVSMTAVGDILGPSISSLDSLIQMPYGCGEQNMINFAPNIYVLQYLNATRQLDTIMEHKVTDYMMKGYEQELSYQRSDGSFSAFGDVDSSGSTWLTAFVLRCFLQARPFISIDAQVLHRAAAWLADQQGTDGRFLEPGRVIHTELQGGQDGPISLTAYVIIALLEDSNIRAQYWSQVSSGLVFLETRLALGVSSNYSLSVLTYALALSGSTGANKALSSLIGRAQTTAGVPVWSFPDAGLSSSWQPRSADIEMVSYVLLSEHKLGRIADGIALMKWLSQQRNHMGGFGSTQDTVVALQAMSMFTALGQPDNVNVTLMVKTSALTTAVFHIQRDNYLLQQSHELQVEQELRLQVTAAGHGLALFQLNVFYNTRDQELMRRKREAGEGEAFNLLVELNDTHLNSAQLLVCSSLSEGLGLKGTGMAIMEVGLLSGLSLSPDGITTDNYVKKVETRPGKVIVYLDSVMTDERCLVFPLVLEYKVTKVQEAAVVIYDYYEPRRRTVRTYESPWRGYVSTCSFCGKYCSDCREDAYTLPAASRAARSFLLTSVLATLLISVFGL